MKPIYDVVIVGDGFSSLCAVSQILRNSDMPPLQIAIIGDKSRWGRGTAYGACDWAQVLNVPSGRMGIDPQAIDTFYHWVRDTKLPQEYAPYIDTGSDLIQAYVPRAWYGEYLNEAAARILHNAHRCGHQIDFISGMAESIIRTTPYRIKINTGNIVSGERIILATGVPSSITTADDPESKIRNPWDFEFDRLSGSHEAIAILGTGLTMVDIIASLAARNFQGHILAISRHGLIPRPHILPPSVPVDWLALNLVPLPGNLRHVMRAMRYNMQRCSQANIPWAWYLEYMRPQTTALWQSWSVFEQKQFLKRVLPYWNVLRHRQPGRSYALLQKLQAQGRLTIQRGQANKDIFEGVAHIFNARVPDYTFKSSPFIQSLIASGVVAAHPNGMGLDVRNNLQVGKDKTSGIYALGCLGIGTFWECTAVPDLRAQAAYLAEILHAQFRSLSHASVQPKKRTAR